MELLNFLPKNILAEINKNEYVQGYLTLPQVAIGCGFSLQTMRVLSMTGQLPKPDSTEKKGYPLLWLPSTIAPFIQQYRKGK